MTSRRAFVKMGAAGLAAGTMFRPVSTWATGQSPTGLKKFYYPDQELRGLGGATGIPVASPTSYSGFDFYQIDLVEFQHRFHPELPNPSKVWGYNPRGNATPGYLGGVIVAHKNRPMRIRFRNTLPTTHPLPVDTSIPGVAGFQNNRAALHMHGAQVDWTSDGGPFNWFDPNGNFGPSVTDNIKVKNGAGQALPGQMELYYPNQQSARMMWYHDHAVGLTRLNAYAGLASACIVRDGVEDALVRLGIIPAREIPLVIQDKTFVDGTDSGYAWGQPGDLWYPYQYEDPEPGFAPPTPSAVPEFFGDTSVVNGVAYPFLKVEPRHYRFRILNASQARFYNLQLYYANASGTDVDHTQVDDRRVPAATAGPRMIQIGTEGGFLTFPAVLNDPPRPLEFDPVSGNATSYTLLMGPGERADVVIDFSNVPVGSKLLLYNDATSPFPAGDPANDCLGSAPDRGPNTRTLMQFIVTPRIGAPDPASLKLLENFALRRAAAAATMFNTLMPPLAPLARNAAVRVRQLTLNEDVDEFGRLIQFLGTDKLPSSAAPTFGRMYEDRPTEITKAGDVEIWRIFNTTGDTHPMHFHLVNVRVLSRQAFTYAIDSSGQLIPTLIGAPRGPDPNERGEKETVRMNPGEVTEVIMRFDLPNVPFHVPNSPRLRNSYGIEGHEYVWHCHILEHEEHDMMRPLVVQP